MITLLQAILISNKEKTKSQNSYLLASFLEKTVPRRKERELYERRSRLKLSLTTTKAFLSGSVLGIEMPAASMAAKSGTIKI